MHAARQKYTLIREALKPVGMTDSLTARTNSPTCTPALQNESLVRLRHHAHSVIISQIRTLVGQLFIFVCMMVYK